MGLGSTGFNINGLDVLSDGEIIVTGSFVSFDSNRADFMIKLNPDGTESND